MGYLERAKTLLWSVLALGFIPAGWRLPSFLMFGFAAGTGAFVLHASRATSYLSDSPETCVNCHVMNTQYVSWQHSGHARVATCNDCHVPHDSMLSHYAFKAKDGLWHATVFTMRWEPQVIRLSPGAVPVVENNCRRCHERLIDHVPSLAAHEDGDHRCWDCHREVPHGRERSLAAGPNVFEPQLPPLTAPGTGPKVGGRRVRPEGPSP
jgi:cytochrome c nitrite reductase small subunit